MNAKVRITYKGKTYRPAVSKHPCRDRRSCSLYKAETCGTDECVDTLPCDELIGQLERVGLTIDFDTNFKEVTK